MNLPANKPRLYMDIDGVIFAIYNGSWQIRPYTKSLLDWADQHFDIYWTSFNSGRAQIVRACYLPGKVCGTDQVPEPAVPSGLPGKLSWIDETGGLDDPWLIIEDTAPTPAQFKILKDLGIANRWIVVPEFGADTLLDVKNMLQGYIVGGILQVPEGWVRMNHRDQGSSMFGFTEYKGIK